MQECEDLWIDIVFSNHKIYTFSVIYRHLQNHHPAFFEALHKRMFMLNKKKKKFIVLGDININLNPENVKPAFSDNIHLLRSNAFFSLITSPTTVTSNSQTSIDHIFTNDYESIVTPGVLLTRYPTTTLYFVL